MLTLKLRPDEAARLRAIAHGFGLTIGRGPQPDMGSFRQLMLEIAAGRLLVVVNPNPPARDNGSGQ